LRLNLKAEIMRKVFILLEGGINMAKEMKILYSENENIINMSKQRFMNLFLINITVDGKFIPLVFDTGASITAISESVADSIGAIPLKDKITVGGNTGKIETVSKYMIPEFEIGDNTIKNLIVIVVPDNQLDFGFDKEGNSLKVNGFLGWDIISNFKWTINPHTRKFIIEKPQWYENKGLLYWDNMPIINAQYDNNCMYFGFDSGNTESMFSKEFIPFLETKHENKDDIAGVGGIIKEDVYTMGNIKLIISDKSIELMNISALKRDIFPNTHKAMGLLAVDIIQNHGCVIDFINEDFRLF